MQIQLNGKDHELPESSTVADLIVGLEIEPRQVAVELNRAIVTRDQRPQTILADGDRVELVTLVGGG